MIKVFALEPDIVTDFSLIQRLEQFGFDQGRILGMVPKTWRKFVNQAIKNADPKHRKAIDIQLDRLAKARALQPLPANDIDTSWISAAINVPSEYLQGIIVDQRGEVEDFRIIEMKDSFGESEVWKVATNALTSRDVKSMASQVSVLMRYAYEIKFIDPYFTGEKRHLDFVVQSLLHRSNSPLKAKVNIEFHCLWKRRQPGDDYATLRSQSRSCFDSLVQSTKDALSDLLRPSDSVNWCQWTEKEDDDHQRFHERYVLTDLGGIEFGGGLDTAGPGQQTSVNLLSKPTVDTLNKRFKKDSSEFELLHFEEL
jgi:hypothetical protein